MIKQSPSLNMITTAIASHLDRELDDPFKRLLAMKVDVWRSTLVSRSLDKNPKQRSLFRQTLYVPMEEASPVDCNVAFPMCAVAKSKFPIPGPMRTGVLFDYIGTIDGRRPFGLAVPGMLIPLTSGKYSRNNIFYEYTNKYIIIAQNKRIPMIRVDDVFDDPLQVMELNCQNGMDCDYWDKPYPCTYDIIQMIIQYILHIDYERTDVPDIREIEVNPLVPKNKYER